MSQLVEFNQVKKLKNQESLFKNRYPLCSLSLSLEREREVMGTTLKHHYVALLDASTHPITTQFEQIQLRTKSYVILEIPKSKIALCETPF
jgi:hypothetical protein